VKKPNIHLCIDRIVPLDYRMTAADLAKQERPRNEPEVDKLRAVQPGVALYPMKIALFTSKMWNDGRTLGVAFLDGSAKQRQLVIKYAQTWSRHANVTFDFSANATADIRVSFQADPGSWSAVGTDCLVKQVFPTSEPTVNFGWLRDDTDETEYRRVVTHEFGHVLGAIHEHQNPLHGGGIKWNLPAVYAYFSGPPNNWTKEEIDHNVIQKYAVDQLNGTKFDLKSIMLYEFPPELIIGGHGTPENTRLSAGDKRFIARAYPKTA
jgi:hypothetical protein